MSVKQRLVCTIWGHHHRLIMPSGKIVRVLYIMMLMVLASADSRVKRYQVEKGETGKYLAQTNAGDPYLCHYCVVGQNYQISDQCDHQNKDRISSMEKEKKMFPMCYPGTRSYPACPPLPAINNGYWMCPPRVYPTSVEVYAVCVSRCLQGYKLQEEVVVRCPESLNWTHSVTPRCFSDDHSCHLYNLSFITQTLHQVIVSWNATSGCKSKDIEFVISGPRQNFTKNLTKNTSFLVIKEIDLDTVYSVALLIDQEEIISGKFRSAAIGIPEKPRHVHVAILNTSAVNVSWGAPRNNSRIMGYMVQISCDSDTLTLNTSKNVVTINELEASRNYTVTVVAFNQQRASLHSDPVYVDLPGIPEKPRHVHVAILNTSAVNVSWGAPRNNSRIMGYMVQISCDSDTLTLNTSKNVVTINELEATKNYTVTVVAFNQQRASLHSDPVYVDLPESNQRESYPGTSTEWRWYLLCLLVLPVILCFVGIKWIKYRKRKRKDRENEVLGGNDAASGQERLQLNEIVAEESRTSSPVCESSQLDRLLVPESGESSSAESSASPELIDAYNLDIGSLENSDDSLQLSEAENLNLDSLNPLGESEDSRNLSGFDSSNAGFSSFLKEIAKNQPKSKTQSSKKAVLGSDSGRGSVSETVSTESSAGSKCTSSQSNSPTGCDKVISQNNFKQQTSYDSGRGSETGTNVEYNDKLPRSSEIKTDIVSYISMGAETPRTAQLKAEPCLTIISEKSNEEDILEEISRQDEQDPEECNCTFLTFTDSASSFQHIKDLGDFLDPDKHYGEEKSWAGFTMDVLQMERFRIPAIDNRCRNGGSPFQTEVLENLIAKGKKIGHLVLYFSKKEHLRTDVLKKVSEFHQGCKLCDTIFAQLNVTGMKVNS